MAPEDIKDGCRYRARRPAKVGHDKDGPILNDRVVFWHRNGRVQYDGPAVADGRHYPIVSIDAFLKWADREIPESEYTRPEKDEAK